MPKIKTHKSTSKRFRRTRGGKGKLMRSKLTTTSKRRKLPRRVRAKLDQKISVESKGVERRVARLVPHVKN